MPELTMIFPPVSADGAAKTAPSSAAPARPSWRSGDVARGGERPLAAGRPAAGKASQDPTSRDELAEESTPRDPSGREFQQTQWSLVLRAGAASPDALRELCEAYRAPLQAFARRIEPDPERADNVVQGFLARILEQKVVGKADPARGRFRAFLRKALRNYAINVHNAETAEKRGGRASYDEPDFDALASEEPGADRLYDRAWARALLDRALARLRDEQMARPDKGAVFEALCERLEGEDDGATLSEAAERLGKTEGAVKLTLFRLRRRYFDLVRAEVAATVAQPEDVDAELDDLRAALRDDG
jgi:RNA polymerase sigma-70 factor (ECF subfamily)